ncbi:MAG: hypothetical protein SO441_01525 [Candidatus Limivicinus sp.]|nr:hypothetical protein [Candidatus Limivicinus sp.]
MLHLRKPQLGHGNREGFYLTGPDRLNAIANCRQGEAADAIEQASHRDFSFWRFRLVLFFSHFFTPFLKNFFSRPLLSAQLGKAGNIFYVFLLYLQKVHNLSVKKGRFLRKILAKIALNRKRAGSSPPWQEKYLSVPHQKMGSKKPRNR